MVEGSCRRLAYDHCLATGVDAATVGGGEADAVDAWREIGVGWVLQGGGAAVPKGPAPRSRPIERIVSKGHGEPSDCGRKLRHWQGLYRQDGWGGWIGSAACSGHHDGIGTCGIGKDGLRCLPAGRPGIVGRAARGQCNPAACAEGERAAGTDRRRRRLWASCDGDRGGCSRATKAIRHLHCVRPTRTHRHTLCRSTARRPNVARRAARSKCHTAADAETGRSASGNRRCGRRGIDGHGHSRRRQ